MIMICSHYLHKEQNRNKTAEPTMESVMFRRIIEDTTEAAAISIFLAMVWMWASALAPAGGG
jgi:hypothetical protein